MTGGQRDDGPPERVVEIGVFIKQAEEEFLCKATHEKGMVPYFNAPIYLENKAKIGRVEEILGPVTDFFFTIKPDTGITAASYVAKESK